MRFLVLKNRALLLHGKSVLAAQVLVPCMPLNGTKQRLNMENNTKKTWLKRIGVAGFLFFLGKGLVWVAVFAGLVKTCN